VLDAVIDGDWERAGHGAFNMMTGADLMPLLGDMASGTVESVTHNVVAIGGEDPYEAGHGSSMIGLDVASVVVPGAIVTRVARTAGAATEAVAVAERGAVVSRGAAASAAERGLGATRVVDDLAAGRAVLEAAGGESAPRLVVGGGRAGDMPRLRPNDVSLNIERTTSPNVLGDINHAPFRNESFPEIVFENVEHSVFVGPGSTTVSATYDLLTPGGRLEIQFGSVNAPIDDVVTRLRAEGFRDVSVRRPTAAETREYLERLGVPEERIASVLERFEAQPSRWVIEATKPSAP